MIEIVAIICQIVAAIVWIIAAIIMLIAKAKWQKAYREISARYEESQQILKKYRDEYEKEK